MTRAVIVIHPGALGDVLLAVPAMRRLRARFPAHRLLLCAADGIAQLLTASGVVDGWLSIEGRSCAELLAGTTSGSGPISEWLARCDAVFAFMKDEEGNLTDALRRYRVPEVTIGSPFSRSLAAKHQSDRFLEIIGESPPNRSSWLPARVSDHLITGGRTLLEEAGVDFDRPLALFHPGSGSPHKRVGPAILAAVIEGLCNAGAVPVVLQGPADEKTVTDLLEQTRTGLIVLQDLDLIMLAGILANVQLFIGHDSGVTHLSALLGVRTIVLFGPTDPERWAPIGSHVAVLRGPSCSCPDWQAVGRCVEKSCLRPSVETILAVCRTQLSMAKTPRRLPARLVSHYPVC